MLPKTLGCYLLVGAAEREAIKFLTEQAFIIKQNYKKKAQPKLYNIYISSLSSQGILVDPFASATSELVKSGENDLLCSLSYVRSLICHSKISPSHSRGLPPYMKHEI